ncbi:MAG: hypothetical protein KJ734_13400, partial [Chloroflexi bacterium]|nr:hypothetical protein [Chloroflexota bacterium]
VDMFISITDTGDKSHTVTFVLPFPMEPQGFAAQEVRQREFDEQVTGPLDRFIDEVRRFEDEVRDRLLINALAGDLLVGQPLYPLAPVLLVGAIRPLTAGAPGPQQVVTTEHSRTEIYAVATQADLEALIAQAGLPAETTAKMRRYVGRYLAIITIQTVPAPPDERGLNALGLHFSFTTAFEAKGDAFQYAYPLSTGDIWGHPIPLTRVYVVAPGGVGLDIAYPAVGQAVDEATTSRTLLYEGHIRDRLGDRMSGPMHSIADADDGQQHVWRITYLAANPSEDVVITARSAPPDTLLVARRALARFLADWSWIGFLGLAALVWLILWRIVVGGLLRPGYSFLNWRYWADALGGWLLYATLDLGFMIVLILVSGGTLMLSSIGMASFDALLEEIGYEMYEMMTIGAGCICPGLLVMLGFVVAAGSTGLLLALWRAPAHRGRGVVALILQVVLSALVYNLLAVGLLIPMLLLV